MKFGTREFAKVDRIACPWLIRRFVDPSGEFLYVPKEKVFEVAEREGATPFDTPGAVLPHNAESGEERVTFEVVLRKFALRDTALADLEEIVRGADAHLRNPRPGSAGREALATGFRAIAPEDPESLRLQTPAYDALTAYGQARVGSSDDTGYAPRA